MVIQKKMCMALICLAVLGLVAVVVFSYQENFIAAPRQPTYPIPEDSLPADYDVNRESVPDETKAKLTGEPKVTPQECNPTPSDLADNQENLIYTRGMNNYVDFSSNSK